MGANNQKQTHCRLKNADGTAGPKEEGMGELEGFYGVIYGERERYSQTYLSVRGSSPSYSANKREKFGKLLK